MSENDNLSMVVKLFDRLADLAAESNKSDGTLLGVLDNVRDKLDVIINRENESKNDMIEIKTLFTTTMEHLFLEIKNSQEAQKIMSEVIMNEIVPKHSAEKIKEKLEIAKLNSSVEIKKDENKTKRERNKHLTTVALKFLAVIGAAIGLYYGGSSLYYKAISDIKADVAPKVEVKKDVKKVE